MEVVLITNAIYVGKILGLVVDARFIRICIFFEGKCLVVYTGWLYIKAFLVLFFYEWRLAQVQLR